jgi:hypothetical protein
MSQLSHMLRFLNLIKDAEGQDRQRLVEHNKPLLRTDLAQQAALQRVELYKRHVRRLELALQLVRAEQQRRAPASPDADNDEGGTGGTGGSDRGEGL